MARSLIDDNPRGPWSWDIIVLKYIKDEGPVTLKDIEEHMVDRYKNGPSRMEISQVLRRLMQQNQVSPWDSFSETSTTGTKLIRGYAVKTNPVPSMREMIAEYLKSHDEFTIKEIARELAARYNAAPSTRQIGNILHAYIHDGKLYRKRVDNIAVYSKSKFNPPLRYLGICSDSNGTLAGLYKDGQRYLRRVY